MLVYKDRLLRFGPELVFATCKARRVEVVIINDGDASTFEEELPNDVLESTTVFSSGLYSTRSHANCKLIDGIRATARYALRC